MPRKRKTREKSAGVITFLPDDGDYKVIILDHGSHISHPKGHIEGSETKKDAAVRELKEETNLELEVMSASVVSTKKYIIEKRSKIINKTVYYYAGIASKDCEIQISEEHTRFLVLIPKQASDTLTYETDRDALESALEWLEASKQQ